MVSVVISPLSFLIVFIWILSLFFSMSLLKGLLICLSFQRTSSWICWSLELCFYFLCHLILLWSWLFTSFYLPWAVFVFVPRVRVFVSLGYLFELFLFFLGRHVSLWTSLSGLPSLCPISLGLLWVHFHLFPESFWFLPWSRSWPIINGMLFNLQEFECFWVFFLEVGFEFQAPVDQESSWYDFNFLEFVEACFVSYHVVYLWKCSMCIWKECVLCLFGVKGSLYIS